MQLRFVLLKKRYLNEAQNEGVLSAKLTFSHKKASTLWILVSAFKP